MGNHSHAVLTCNFFVAATAAFRVLYVFVVMGVGSRRLMHYNVTAHPTTAKTVQQFREAQAEEDPYHFAVHDRDGVCAPSGSVRCPAWGHGSLSHPRGVGAPDHRASAVVPIPRRDSTDLGWAPS